MTMKRIFLSFAMLFVCLSVCLAQNKKWTVESESPAARVTWQNDGVIDIMSPKGLTLWYNQRMTGNVVVEYDARICFDESKPVSTVSNPETCNRLSDLNCFWMASDCGGSVFTRAKQRGGKFVNQYALQLYYMGYGGNGNSTTRFRRYSGDVRGVDSVAYRPVVLREYLDSDHLLEANRWYHVRLEQVDGRARYFIDGKCLVDYLDPCPLVSGYFGFRTTLAHAQLRNFRFTESDPDVAGVPLVWVGSGAHGGPQTFGVPFAKGEVLSPDFSLVSDKGKPLAFDTWTLASWPDGSVKWQAFATVVPSGVESCCLRKVVRKGREISVKKVQPVKEAVLDNRLRSLASRLEVELNGRLCPVFSSEIERSGNVRSCLKMTGDGFLIRMYAYEGSSQVKVEHTLFVDSALNVDGLHSLSLVLKQPMHSRPYERFVQFDNMRPMSVQPLVARRPIRLNADGTAADSVTWSMLKNIAQWDGFRLSQLSPNAFSVRKRATSLSPWIGTIEGRRSEGIVTVGDSISRVSVCLADFWQSYPSSLRVDAARSDTARISVCLYSPEAEPFCFAHYDTIAHTLEAAYEDVQEGLSTAYGIARTSVIYIDTHDDVSSVVGAGGKSATSLTLNAQLLPTPEYLHRKRAFGIWSIPGSSSMETLASEGKSSGMSSRDSLIEANASALMKTYENEIERRGWYGFWHYGDVMHSYDTSRDEWRYDVGGFAWDNTELGTPAMFWYQFLRTGDASVWRMAEAMTRHCSEVDTYHFGPNAGLGSRHNVSHWGCGAKEARISEAWWNRFYYYLTANERTGDIISEVALSDTLLYSLDPMRLAQPRSLFPCTAPARLRLGPDWLAYASNWLAAWERDSLSEEGQRGRRLLLSGMKSIAGLSHGFFTGPKALGYDPATGVITCECSESIMNTNHLMTIMGGFELMNEMEAVMSSSLYFVPAFWKAWLDHACNYKEYALRISGNNFRVPRLKAYASWRTGNVSYAKTAWSEILGHIPSFPCVNSASSASSSSFFTNDAATWILDAIFAKEVLP